MSLVLISATYLSNWAFRMAPSQLVWQSDNGKCSTLPWSAAGTGGLLLHRQPFLGAWLRELWPGQEPRDVEVSFYSQGFCRTAASCERVQIRCGCAGRRAATVEAVGGGGWREAGAADDLPNSRAEVGPAHDRRVGGPLLCFLASPAWACRAPNRSQPAHVGASDGEAAQCGDPAAARAVAQEKEQKAEIIQEKQNLQKQLDDLMALQRENEALQRTVLTSKVQKSEELAQHILKLKEDCDDVLAPQHKQHQMWSALWF